MNYETVQLMTERALNNEFAASGATSAIFVVAEAKTGKIIASATKPSFDPNIKDIENYLNPLISIPFEPGSTMKTYTYMATMEKGNYNGNDMYQSGTMEISGYTIKDWNGYGWGTVSYDFGYMQSSNIGIANLMQKYLTGDELKAYLKKLGFPDSYISKIVELHAKHPKWQFKLMNVDVDFNKLVKLEYDGYSKGWSLIEDTGNYYDGYKSFDSWSYNYLTNQFVGEYIDLIWLYVSVCFIPDVFNCSISNLLFTERACRKIPDALAMVELENIFAMRCTIEYGARSSSIPKVEGSVMLFF